MNRAWLTASIVYLWAASAGAEELMIAVRPAEIYQGGVAEIMVSGQGVAEVKARRRAEDLVVFSVEAGYYAALVGIDIDDKPGKAEISLSGRSAGESWSRTAAITVKHKDFPREEITVPASFDRLDAATLERIKKEQAALNRLWKIHSPRVWDGDFIAPVPVTVNSAFGFRRIVN